MRLVRLVIAWTMFLGGIVGLAFGIAGVIAPKEPKWVLGLSFGALIYEGFNGVMIASQD